MHTKLVIALFTATCFVGAATGCDDKKDDASEKDDKKKKKKKKKDDEDEDEEDEAEEKDDGEADSDMPKVCKDYLAALDKCMDNENVPEASKEGFKQGKKSFESAFTAAKGQKAAIDALTATCTSSLDAVKQACK